LTPARGEKYLFDKENSMATITLNGSTVHTWGELPRIGSHAPNFLLTKSDMSDVDLSAFKGKKKILSIAVSLDTGVCAAGARAFNAAAAGLGGAVVLTITNDLPFAQKRFCEAENINTVITLSQLRNRDFGRAYGVEMMDGALAGLLSRAVVILDENDTVIYREQVPEITREPDYARALQALRAPHPNVKTA
jgi:thiol peroxidase